jgi:CRISPR/Cas system-associated exonuclease Cas4 (RecB family)
MTARDIIHEAVRNALIKDGWTITDDPYTIKYEDVTVYADLAAERMAAAERAARRIVVEVKSFVSPSSLYDLELALGQYQLYRSLLEVTAPDRELYLAVPATVYMTFFVRTAIDMIVRRLRIALLVIDTDKQEVVTWTS